MREFLFKPDEMICPQSISFSIENGVMISITFEGGCEGNLSAICRLATGMTPDALIERLSGIDCDGKGTSCPDQLARALMAWKTEATDVSADI